MRKKIIFVAVRLQPRTLLLTAAAILVSSAFLFVSERLWVGSVATSEILRIGKAEVQQRRTVLETEIVKVTRRGFEPNQITRPQGKFILMIENPTWQNLNLRFAPDVGARLNEVRTSRDQPDWNDVLDLNPGRYLLTEADHPEWTCVVTITSR